jgi:hypothetical protein
MHWIGSLPKSGHSAHKPPGVNDDVAIPGHVSGVLKSMAWIDLAVSQTLTFGQ